jgi:hypothetical protein
MQLSNIIITITPLNKAKSHSKNTSGGGEEDNRDDRPIRLIEHESTWECWADLGRLVSPLVPAICWSCVQLPKMGRLTRVS